MRRVASATRDLYTVTFAASEKHRPFASTEL